MNELDLIVIDLEIVGQLRSSDKLGVHALPGVTRLVVDSGAYTQFIVRWYNGTGRDTALDYLNQLVQRCQNTAKMIVDGSLKNMGCLMKSSANRAITGLQNLQSTYSTDSSTVAKIGLFINKLHDVCSVLKSITEDEHTE